MSGYWSHENMMQRILDFLRQSPNGVCTDTQCEIIPTANVMMFMFAVICMCSSSWVPLITKQPARGRDDRNPPPPPANN